MPETCINFGEHGARIMIEEKEVPHFAIDVNSEKKEVSCWIASEEGKAFTIEWLEVDVDYSSSGSLFLDGQWARKLIRVSHVAELVIFRRGWVSESSLAPFIFSKLGTTDDDTHLDTTPSLSIGEIQLVISRTTMPKMSEKNFSTHLLPPQKVHERSKKAISHQVNFGSEIPAPELKFSSSIDLERLVTFIFRYRPFEMLLANDIVPRNPELLKFQEHTLDTPTMSETPSGNSEVKKEAESESESDDSDEDSDGMTEMALLAKLEKIRKRKQLKDKRPKKKMKKEEKPFFTSGEVIDLIGSIKSPLTSERGL